MEKSRGRFFAGNELYIALISSANYSSFILALANIRDV